MSWSSDHLQFGASRTCKHWADEEFELGRNLTSISWKCIPFQVWSRYRSDSPRKAFGFRIHTISYILGGCNRSGPKSTYVTCSCSCKLVKFLVLMVVSIRSQPYSSSFGWYGYIHLMGSPQFPSNVIPFSSMLIRLDNIDISVIQGIWASHPISSQGRLLTRVNPLSCFSLFSLDLETFSIPWPTDMVLPLDRRIIGLDCLGYIIHWIV